MDNLTTICIAIVIYAIILSIGEIISIVLRSMNRKQIGAFGIILDSVGMLVWSYYKSQIPVVPYYIFTVIFCVSWLVSLCVFTLGICGNEH